MSNIIRIFLYFFLFKNTNLILHPSLENSTTRITIMEMEEHIDQLTCNAHSWVYPLIKIIVKGQLLSLALQSFFFLLSLDQIWSILHHYLVEFVMYSKGLSMNQLLSHTFAHLTGPSFRLKAKLLPIKNILGVEYNWVNSVKKWPSF